MICSVAVLSLIRIRRAVVPSVSLTSFCLSSSLVYYARFSALHKFSVMLSDTHNLHEGNNLTTFLPQF